MKKLITLLFILSGFILLPTAVTAVGSPTQAKKVENSFLGLNAEDIINYDRKELESKIGRKLKLKEKVALKFLKRKLKKEIKKKSAQANEETKTENLAIAGFVLGLLSLFLLPIIGSILAIIFSSKALKRMKQNPETSSMRGLAKAGLIIGIVGLVLVSIILIPALFGVPIL